MLRKDFHDLQDNGVIGDWCFMADKQGQEDAYICFIHPSTKNRMYPRLEGADLAIIPIKPEFWRNGNGPVWTWDGNREVPTISPSVRVLGGDGQPDEWHGWLTAGKIVNA